MIQQKQKRTLRTLIITAVILLGLVIGCVIYVNDFYHADTEAIEDFTADSPIKPQPDEKGNLIFAPEHATAGLIFYPGGKVEYTAYIPLMNQLAAEGILCVLIEMPWNLAVLDMDAAKGIQEQYPEIENWYIGGHSLGGSMAASYLSKSPEKYKGLILLGSYSTADLTENGLEVLSIYGSEDFVLNKEKYAENKGNLPKDFTEIVIEGGCHAYFGMYGAQEGDGTPSITNQEQIELTKDAIIEFMK